MKKIFLFSICIIATQITKAQVADAKSLEAQTYQTKLSQITKTLVINMSGFSMNFIGEFKDEVIGWQGKVISINLNEDSKIISIVHNELLDPREISDILSKYQIVKDRIISHQ